jgi:hypothetical protein
MRDAVTKHAIRTSQPRPSGKNQVARRSTFLQARSRTPWRPPRKAPTKVASCSRPRCRPVGPCVAHRMSCRAPSARAIETSVRRARSPIRSRSSWNRRSMWFALRGRLCRDGTIKSSGVGLRPMLESFELPPEDLRQRLPRLIFSSITSLPSGIASGSLPRRSQRKNCGARATRQHRQSAAVSAGDSMNSSLRASISSTASASMR